MRILLYNPASFYYTGRKYNQLPMLGLAILSRLFNDAGHSCEVYDFETMGITPDKLRDPQVDWIGFTCPTIAVRGIKDSIAQLRKVGYKGRIMVGGIHATLYPQQMLEMGADLVVTGECEGNIVQLIESGATGIYAGKQLPIEDIPSPDWENYYPPLSEYFGQYAILHPKAGVAMWERGCPYKCIYCANLIFNGQATRYRPPEKIEAEMRDLKSRGIDKVYVYDDEMIGTALPDGWMKEIADRLEPLKMTWITQSRCSKKHVTLDILKDMKRAGCHTIFWGVESFSQHVLDTVRKRLTPEDVVHSLRLAHQAGIKNCIFLMVGNYKETETDLQETERVLARLYNEGLIDYQQTFPCKIQPGTEMERITIDEGWHQPAEFAMCWTRKAPFPTPWLSSNKIMDWKRRFASVCPVPAP